MRDDMEKISPPIERLHIDCECSSLNHLVRVTYDPDDTYAELGEVYVETQLNTWRPWYNRLWLAVRYVLGLSTSPYGHYDETIVSVEDRRKLVALLRKSLGESE